MLRSFFLVSLAAACLVFGPDAYATRTASDFKGLKHGFYMKYKDDDQITVTVGKLHNTNSSSVDKILELTSDLDSNAFTLTGTNWYYVYIEAPASGATPTAGGVKCVSNKEPDFVAAKLGWYHPDENDQRCIGAVWVNDGVIQPFIQTAQRFQLTDTSLPQSTDSVIDDDSSSPTRVELDGPSFALESAVIVRHYFYNPTSKGGEVYYAKFGGSAGILIAKFDDSTTRFRASTIMDIQIVDSGGTDFADYFVNDNSEDVRMNASVLGYVMPFAIGETSG